MTALYGAMFAPSTFAANAAAGARAHASNGASISADARERMQKTPLSKWNPPGPRGPTLH